MYRVYVTTVLNPFKKN